MRLMKLNLVNQIIMKKTINFLIVFGIAVLSSCKSGNLGREEINRLLLEGKAYPKVVEYRIFCGNNETAEEMHNLGLDRQGLVVVQLKHTLDDVGRPLINFTEKAKPFLLKTPRVHESIDVQYVKLADEYFGEVTNVTTNAKGDRAEVEFTTSLKNKTPFIDMSKENRDDIQTRITYFSLTSDGWKWDGKIIKSRPHVQ